VAFEPGTLLGAYEILTLIGSGGMGDVYRAKDTKLGREVALKILPATFTNDPDRIARFRREAQVLASLNHPHIAQIHGLDEAAGAQFLVLELVDGESLDKRIARGPIPLDEALRIAKQIAEALEAAHEKGIIHRDLKPANVALTHEDEVKVLDFGLAKATEAATGTSLDVTNSPTITTPVMMTGIGVILGTAAYMSPEQAKGRPADKRSDVWAFGCVLYEMLAGKRPFDGEDVSDTLAAVLRGEPNWNALTANVPQYVRLLLRKCLEKDRTRRIADISTVNFVIAESIDGAPFAGALDQRSPGQVPHSRIGRWLPATIATITLGVVVATLALALRPSSGARGVTRLTFPLPDGQQYTNAGRKLMAVSGDGTKMAYVANGRLFLKAADRAESVALTVNAEPEGAEGVTTPVFSQDGRWIAFWSGAGSTIRKVASTGGTPVTLCAAQNPFGMSWDGDSILFAEGPRGIMRVSASGGGPELLVRPGEGEVLAAPEMLPAGHVLLYTVAKGGMGLDRWDKAQIVAQRLDSSQRAVVVDGGAEAHYVASGHLMYAVGGSLFAVPFDAAHVRVTGPPVPVVEGVRRSSIGVTSAANFGVSDTGVLAYIPGSAVGSAGRDLALIDRKGSIEALKLVAKPYYYPRVSPDGHRLAVTVDDGSSSEIWIHDLTGSARPFRLTFGGRNNFSVWSSDGTRVTFGSDREGDRAIFWQRVDAPGPTAERLTTPANGETHIPTSWSPNGDVLLFTVAKASGTAMWTFSRSDRQRRPFDNVRSEGAQPNGTFSPDGKWVAYNVIEGSGRSPEVFVQPFPATGDLFQIGVGVNSMWSLDGRQLFVSQASGAGGSFAAFEVSTQQGFRASGPTLWPRPGAILIGGLPRNYDVLPDSQRFVIVVESGASSVSGSAGSRIEFVLNWFEELRARVPTK